MNKTVLLGTTLAAVFVVFMIAPAFAVGHLTITEAEVNEDKVEIETAADIPTDGSAGAFGYGAFTTDGKVVAVTTHGGVGPDSESQAGEADPVFHSHLVELTDVTGCASGLAVASASFEEIAPFEIDDDKVEIKDIEQELNGVVVSFSLTLEAGDICVNPISIVDTAENDEKEFTAKLTGSQEVPSVVTDTTGKASFKVGDDKIELKLEVEDGILVIAAHIHCAPAGENGPVVVGLLGGVTLSEDVKLKATITDASITNTACGDSIEALADSMRDGGTYVNVHTVENPGGEIRGQIVPDDD